MVGSLNHVTFAVSDIERSFRFYTNVLECRPVARWENGAYLTAGDTWIALVLSDGPIDVRTDYSHIAFSCTQAAFPELRTKLEAASRAWSENTTEGDSFYFLDPDGHRLEIHVGDLKSRLAVMRAQGAAMEEFPSSNAGS